VKLVSQECGKVLSDVSTSRGLGVEIVGGKGGHVRLRVIDCRGTTPPVCVLGKSTTPTTKQCITYMWAGN
jgi:hypothetical protein